MGILGRRFCMGGSRRLEGGVQVEVSGKGVSQASIEIRCHLGFYRYVLLSTEFQLGISPHVLLYPTAILRPPYQWQRKLPMGE